MYFLILKVVCTCKMNYKQYLLYKEFENSVKNRQYLFHCKPDTNKNKGFFARRNYIIGKIVKDSIIQYNGEKYDYILVFS